jgi:hypothetical protein
VSQMAFSLTAAVLFLLIALGHAVRLTLGVEWMVAGRTIPMWPSWVAILIAALLALEGFRLSGKSG